jgi:outer membrane protein assembly factor BamB
VVLIELGPIPLEPSADIHPRRPLTLRQLRLGALALGVALLLAAGGSGPPPAPALIEIATMPLLPGMTMATGQGFLLTTDRLFVPVRDSDGSTWLISAYELEHGRLVWTSRFEAHPAVPVTLEHRAGLLLVSGPRLDRTGMRTIALDARTGQERWSLPQEVQALPDGQTALGTEMIFPAGSEIADGRQVGGDRHGSPWGREYSVAPTGFVATGIGLGSGRVLWRSEPVTNVGHDWFTMQADGALPRPTRDASLLVVVVKGGGVELRDARTGTVRHRFPAVYRDEPPQLRDGLLLVRHTEREVTVYSTDTYHRQWTRELGDDSYLNFCGGTLVCDSTPTGARVIDSATGAPAWNLSLDNYLGQIGEHLVEFDLDSTLRPLRILDPRTGRTLVDLAAWRGTSSFLSGPGPLLLTSMPKAVGPTWLGVLAPGAATPVTLDPVPYGVVNCQVTLNVIACETSDGDLRIWRYRLPAAKGD